MKRGFVFLVFIVLMASFALAQDAATDATTSDDGTADTVTETAVATETTDTASTNDAVTIADVNAPDTTATKSTATLIDKSAMNAKGIITTKSVAPAWAKTIKEAKPKMCSCPSAQIVGQEARDKCIKSCQGITLAVEKLTISEELVKTLQVAEQKMCKVCPEYIKMLGKCEEYIKSQSQYCNDLKVAIEKLSIPILELELVEPNDQMCKVCPKFLQMQGKCAEYCKSFQDATIAVQSADVNPAGLATIPEAKKCSCPDAKIVGQEVRDACIQKCKDEANKVVVAKVQLKNPGFFAKLFAKRNAATTGNFWSIFN